MAKRTAHWLVKSEPDTFSFEDLLAAPGRTTPWDGVRNHQARNFMRDAMHLGDQVLFYHSSCAVPAAVGWCEVASAPYPDPTQFDPDSPYFDARSRADDPTWLLVDIRAVAPLARALTLAELRAERRLHGMALLARGSRLSVQPLRPAEWRVLVELAKLKK